MTTARHHYLTPAQVELLTTMVNERFAPEDDQGRAPYRAAWSQIDSREDFNRVLADLKATPTLARRQAQAARPVRALRAPLVSEPGYYRNPETGELYRIVERTEKVRWHEDKTVLRVAKYSETGGLRRLTTAGALVKGSWKQYGKYDSIRLRREIIKAEWFLTVEQLADYAYSFCGNCGRALVDGVSVAIGIGPDCAEKLGIDWSEEAAQAAVARREAAAE